MIILFNQIKIVTRRNIMVVILYIYIRTICNIVRYV